MSVEYLAALTAFRTEQGSALRLEHCSDFLTVDGKADQRAAMKEPMMAILLDDRSVD